MFKDAQEVIDQALGALELYAQHYGSSTPGFQPHRDEILKVLRARVQRLYHQEKIGAAKLVEGFISSLENVVGSQKPDK